MLRWRLLQLADSGFPSGGFAHSSGLEAAAHLGRVRTSGDLVAHIDAFLWNAGNAALPFVGAAFDEPQRIWALDAQVDAVLLNHVANRASRTQGRAFAATCDRIYDHPNLAARAERARTREVAAHLSPLFGATLAELGLSREETLGLYLYVALRGLASAAVRLGLVGPHEAARIVASCARTTEAVLAQCSALRPEEAACTAPILDLVASTHDELYARIFQS